MQIVLAVCAGIALAAACGFRVFVPLLGISLATASNWIQPAGGMEWVGSGPTVVMLSVAAVAELLGFYVPVVDHLLDTIASPAAVVAGTFAAAAMLPGGEQLHPALKWAAALIAGGGAAAVVQAGTVTTRGVSGLATGTIANPIVATIENVFAIVLSVLAIVVPIIAAVIAVIIVAWVVRRIARLRRGRATVAAAP